MKVYFATVLFEKNRWNREEKSFLNILDWLDRIKDAGFDGLELWEYHAYQLSDSEIQQVKNYFPDIIFNTYEDFSVYKNLSKVTEYIHKLDCIGCKFNFGNNSGFIERYIDNITKWRKNFREPFRLICECHKNTICEDPIKAYDVLSRIKTEVLVHANSGENVLNDWFSILGDYITHSHINFFRCSENVWLNEEITDVISLIKSHIKTATLEFTYGVGDEKEDVNKLFNNAVRDMLKFKSIH